MPDQTQRKEQLQQLQSLVDEINKISGKPQLELEYSYREPKRIAICWKGGERIAELAFPTVARTWLTGVKTWTEVLVRRTPDWLDQALNEGDGTYKP